MLYSGDDDDVVEVFGSSADKADATDVDFFDDVLLRGSAGNGLLKGIEVDDDEVNLWYLILRQLFAVAIHIATSQNAAKHFGVQRFDASAEYRRIACQRFDGNRFNTQVVDEFIGAASRIDGNALGCQGADDVLQPVFIVDGNEG